MSDQEMTGSRRIEYVPLASLKGDPRNPKAHRIDAIEGSVGRFGYVEPIVLDERTGYIVSGHGRTESLRLLKERGETPPEGLKADPDTGEWLVPVTRGWASRTDSEAAAALIALNRTTEIGGWNDEALLDLLDDLGKTEDGLVGVGYEDDEIDELRKAVAEAGRGGGGPEKYTRGTDIPQYDPVSEEPPTIAELVDTSKTDALTERILATPDLPEDVRDFLLLAAQRHTVFHYARVAEFYAHAPAPVQELMEESALVVIDIDDAMANGFVRFSEKLEEITRKDLAALGKGDAEVLSHLAEPTGVADGRVIVDGEELSLSGDVLGELDRLTTEPLEGIRRGGEERRRA